MTFPFKWIKNYGSYNIRYMGGTKQTEGFKHTVTQDECALYRLLALKPEGDCEGGLVSGGLNSSP